MKSRPVRPPAPSPAASAGHRPPRRPPLDRLFLAGGALLFLIAAGVVAWALGVRPSFLNPGTGVGPVRAWFTPTLTSGIEPAAPLHVEADVPDPEPDRKGPRPLPYVYVELRDAAGQPALYGTGPTDPQPMLLRGLPAVWQADISAPTAPGSYHIRLNIQAGTQPTQTVDLATPVLTVVTPTVPLQSGLVYDRDGNLWLTSSDGTRTRKLTFYPRTEQASEPAWTPDGGRIAFVLTLPVPDVVLPVREIWSVRPDGTDARVLVPRQPGEDLLYPAYAPDGQLLVTVDRIVDPATGGTPTTEQIDQGIETFTIDAVDLPTGTRHPLVTDARMPDVSRDGKRLVYVALPPGKSETEQILTRTLMLADRDGGNPRVLVPGDVFQDIRSPRFSPDGTQIAFAAVNPGGWEGGRRDDWWSFLAPPVAANGVPWDIYTVPVAGGTPQRVTRFQADLPTVAWGTDPAQLAVLTERNLFRVPLDGSAPAPLAPGALHGGVSWYTP
jgi:Tol biopolymer transport system component